MNKLIKKINCRDQKDTITSQFKYKSAWISHSETKFPSSLISEVMELRTWGKEHKCYYLSLNSYLYSYIQ